VKQQKEKPGSWMIPEIETTRKESVVVNGFAEAAPTRAKQGKDSHMILFSKKGEKNFSFWPFGT
jgi:hypothetical protein